MANAQHILSYYFCQYFLIYSKLNHYFHYLIYRIHIGTIQLILYSVLSTKNRNLLLNYLCGNLQQKIEKHKSLCNIEIKQQISFFLIYSL